MRGTLTACKKMKDNSIALSYDGKTLEWARAERSRDGVSMSASGTFGDSPKESAFVDPAEFKKASAEYSHKISSSLSDAVTLAVSTSRLILRTSRFPSTDGDEIASMSLNQMEKDAPLPLDEMVCSFEVLSTDETSSLVLSAGTPVSCVEEISATAGVSPGRVERVDALFLGILKTLLDKKVVGGMLREVIVAEEGSSMTLAILDSGKPISIRSMGDLASLNTGSLLNTTLLALMQTQQDHGKADLTRFVCFSDSLQLQSAVATVADARGCAVKHVSPKSFPPAAYGVALRTVDGAAMNLFPEGWRTKLAEGKFRRTYRYSLLAGAALWLLTAGWIYGWPLILDQRVKSLNAVVKRLEPDESKVVDLRNRISIIDRYSDRTFSPMEALLEVAVNQPQGIDLSSFRFNGAKNQTLVEGRSRVPTLVYDFMDRLKTSKIFREVKLSSGPTLNRALGLNVFELSIEFKTREQMEAESQ